MQLSRSQGISHHSQRDFEQERADLTEGYNNYKQWVATSIAEVSESSEYSSEQKRNLLNAYKADLGQKQQEYNDALTQINMAENQYKAEHTEKFGYGQGDADEADGYCSFSDETDDTREQTSSDYCGSAAQQSASVDYHSERDYSLSSFEE